MTTGKAVKKLKAPFPYFGVKYAITDLVWSRLGKLDHYIEPFCGTLAMLLNNPHRPRLENVNDINGFIANFWRAVKHDPAAVQKWADYPVSHVDLGARHRWLLEQRTRIGEGLSDPNWPGDAQVAGWWLWGQSAWIGSGFATWQGPAKTIKGNGQIPIISGGGQGVHGSMYEWNIQGLSTRMAGVSVLHGEWIRCLSTGWSRSHKKLIGAFLDPPYRSFESLYASTPVATEVEAWAKANEDLKIALCGHVGDYPTLEGWEAVPWKRTRGGAYGSKGTSALECVWFSPACVRV